MDHGLPVQELVEDVHCIIEAMIGRSSEVRLMRPQLLGIPYTLLGDPDRVRGILLNLYSNAAKFTKKGAISLKACIIITLVIPLLFKPESLQLVLRVTGLFF